MEQHEPRRRSGGGPATALGLVSTLQFGVFTLLWATGVDPLPADVPAGPAGFIALNALATLLLAAGTVAHAVRARMSRPVLLASGAAAVAVLAWLVVNLVAAPAQAGFSTGVLVLVLVCVAGFTVGLLRAGLDRGMTTTGERTDSR